METAAVRTDHRLGSAALAGLAMLLAGSTVAVAPALDGYPVLGAQAARYGLAALLLVPLILGRREVRWPGRRELALVVAVGATGLAAFNVCVVLAVREADPTAVGVIVGGVPVVLALVDPLLRRRWPAGRLVAAAAVVTVGAALVQGIHGSTTPRGLALSFGALASEAAFSLLAAPVLPRLGPLCTSLYACAAAAGMLGAGAVAAGGGMAAALPVPTPVEAAVIVYLGVATPVAFVAWYASIERIGVARTGVLAALVPVGTLVTALAIGTSAFRPLTAAGTLVVCAGLAVALTGRRG